MVPHEIKREHLRIIEKLGQGQFGEVSKAILQEHRSLPAYPVKPCCHASFRLTKAAISFDLLYTY